jgi:hypothetical protein
MENILQPVKEGVGGQLVFLPGQIGDLGAYLAESIYLRNLDDLLFGTVIKKNPVFAFYGGPGQQYESQRQYSQRGIKELLESQIPGKSQRQDDRVKDHLLETRKIGIKTADEFEQDHSYQQQPVLLINPGYIAV